MPAPTELEQALAAARDRLVEADRAHVAACEAQHRAERAARVAERDLVDAKRAWSTNVGAVPQNHYQETPPPSLSAARDAAATAKARLQQAENDERAARRGVEKARTAIETARHALMEAHRGSWAEYARVMHAEAARLEELAAEARREAALAEEKVRQPLEVDIATLNRMQAEQQGRRW